MQPCFSHSLHTDETGVWKSCLFSVWPPVWTRLSCFRRNTSVIVEPQVQKRSTTSKSNMFKHSSKWNVPKEKLVHLITMYVIVCLHIYETQWRILRGSDTLNKDIFLYLWSPGLYILYICSICMKNIFFGFKYNHKIHVSSLSFCSCPQFYTLTLA